MRRLTTAAALAMACCLFVTLAFGDSYDPSQTDYGGYELYRTDVTHPGDVWLLRQNNTWGSWAFGGLPGSGIGVLLDGGSVLHFDGLACAGVEGFVGASCYVDISIFFNDGSRSDEILPDCGTSPCWGLSWDLSALAGKIVTSVSFYGPYNLYYWQPTLTGTLWEATPTSGPPTETPTPTPMKQWDTPIPPLPLCTSSSPTRTPTPGGLIVAHPKLPTYTLPTRVAPPSAYVQSDGCPIGAVCAHQTCGNIHYMCFALGAVHGEYNQLTLWSGLPMSKTADVTAGYWLDGIHYPCAENLCFSGDYPFPWWGQALPAGGYVIAPTTEASDPSLSTRFDCSGIPGLHDEVLVWSGGTPGPNQGGYVSVNPSNVLPIPGPIKWIVDAGQPTDCQLTPTPYTQQCRPITDTVYNPAHPMPPIIYLEPIAQSPCTISTTYQLLPSVVTTVTMPSWSPILPGYGLAINLVGINVCLSYITITGTIYGQDIAAIIGLISGLVAASIILSEVRKQG